MEILGLDNGYHYTKTSEGVIFASTYKRGVDDINKTSIQVNVDGEDFIVGDDNGEYVADNNKIGSKVTELCTFTSIGLSYKDKNFIECKPIVGLPVSYYSEQKDNFKNKLVEYGMKRLKIKLEDGRIIAQDIRIIEPEVYPQSVGVVFLNAKDIKNEDSLVIDGGGGTWDISLFHGLKLIDKMTLEEGQLVLYNKVAQYLNSKYGTRFKNYHIDDKLQTGYINTNEHGKIMLNNEKEVQNIITSHMNAVITDIKRSFAVGNVDNTYVIGGGGIRNFEQIKKEIKNAQLCDDAQFTNAKAFKFMGQMKNR